MKATEAKLLSFLQKSPQFVIPIYQRTYSWTEKQCRQLWDDIVRAGSSDEIAVHFIGSIVYVEEGLSQVTHQAPLLVIDGQQRLTTLTLLIEALARSLGDEEPVEGFSAEKLRAYYLTNPLEKGDRYFKLILSQTDASSLKAYVRGDQLPADASLRISENLALFEQLLDDGKADLEIVCRGLAKLVVVDIALTRDQDNPQLIFESMNSTGKELSQADLIRNFILMGLEPELQTRLYEVYWRPMELDFGQQAYGDRFDGFMRHYLTVRTGDIPRERDVYEAFKDYSRTPTVLAAGVEELVRDIRAFAGYFCAMALGREQDRALAAVFSDLRELRNEVAYPFLLELYHDYTDGTLEKKDFVTAAQLIEAYIFRRAICSIPTNSMNRTFANFSKSIDKNSYLESIKAHFLMLASYRRFPRDEEFHREIQTRDLYNFRIRSYWLRRLENFGRKERVSVDEYTIEHILPQNPDLPAAWRQSLGEDWKAVQEQFLHTLGNLTLTGYNAEYSDRPFAEKRDMKGGFRDSPLQLNEGLGQRDDWNAESISERAAGLATQALAVWPAPELPDEVLESYRPKAQAKAGGYSIEDHERLTSPHLGPIFEALRAEIFALDPCVTEEFLKLYVAYRAETNFVDVLAQNHRLRLSLNMPFSEISDPRGICDDVTGKGRWGNGDVSVFLDAIDDIPYVMGLIRQSLERQLGDNGQT
jgi:uncharacterized protein with ParB-like and HNH nuclease domain/predicted transport protein